MTLSLSSFLYERFSSHTKMEASGEGNSSRSKYEAIFKCTLSNGKAGPGPFLPKGEGGVHVKIQSSMLVLFFGFEIAANPIFGGCRILALFCEVT